MKQYAERDLVALDEAGDYYLRHVSAMAEEGLHSKSAIAAELGYRDMEIDSLRAQLAEAQKKAVARIDELNKLNTENELLSNRVEALQEKAEALDRLEEMAGSDYLQIIGDDGILSLYQGGYWSEESTSLKDLITKAYERSKP